MKAGAKPGHLFDESTLPTNSISRDLSAEGAMKSAQRLENWTVTS